jgi:hypothetical protein
MAIEVSLAARHSAIGAPVVFSWALIGATTLPFMAFVSRLPVAVPALMIVLMLGGTRVAATGYC